MDYTKKGRRIDPITRTRRPSYNKIVNAIEEILPKRTSIDIEDIARLMCLYLCGNVLFRNSKGRIAWSFVINVENLSKKN